MDLNEILNIEVSYFENFSSLPRPVFLKNVFEEIRGSKHGRVALYLNELYQKGDAENYSAEKRKLPIVTFCANFQDGRKKENLKDYNSIAVLDIDKLGSVELKRVKDLLYKEDYVLCYWESPSKDGIKGLVHLKYNFNIDDHDINEAHKMGFTQLVAYFSNCYNVKLDISGCDFTRLCFISQDTRLVLKTKLVSFNVDYKPIAKPSKRPKSILTQRVRIVSSKDALYNPKFRNRSSQKKTISNIIKYLNKSSKSITYDYGKWLQVGFAIATAFTYDVGIEYFKIMSKMDETKYNENDCVVLLQRCYENTKREIGFSTIIHLAVEKGFKYKDLNAKST